MISIIFFCTSLGALFPIRLILKGNGDNYIPGFNRIKKDDLHLYDMKMMRFIQALLLSLIVLLGVCNGILTLLQPNVRKLPYSLCIFVYLFLCITAMSKLAVRISKYK